jgi:RNA polymerase sigma-70 factor, ECF subfamily
LPFSLDSALSWPLAKPTNAESRAGSVESEVVALFDQFRDPLLRYLMALGLQAHDGEEIIQETFLLLFQHLQNEKPRQNLPGWIFRVARNLALKQRAANQRRMVRTIEFEDSAIEQHSDREENPEEQLQSKQRQQRLLAIVGALAEKDKSCLYMRASGLRYREISLALGISLGSVAASLARSLQKLGRADGRNQGEKA